MQILFETTEHRFLEEVAPKDQEKEV